MFSNHSSWSAFFKIASFHSVDFHRNNTFHRFNQKLICVSKSMFSKKKFWNRYVIQNTHFLKTNQMDTKYLYAQIWTRVIESAALYAAS